ncbi:hypothetical protein ACQ86N_06455 [Puia sp. P3]|uniref:hypothetical protein n=1 Tax=Puia sp. P3 TaxID=3423952 RepID=UPI003D67FE5A
MTENALPTVVAKDALVQDLVADGVSASYPYAAMSIPPFATALHVPHASPRMVYVPDDPRLGKFRRRLWQLVRLSRGAGAGQREEDL